ncbi:NlpC/P60 family protein [Mucilaginibacter lappiensis]|uniref:Cell wall-associated NlpC family hydrolase n=1 Tax=Mucilaginibacter lappiensis TaxID=354630 RepID=A0ABR6PJS7_9SPHI|nr:C40 family peptidase [Mucilaginibacter lappiensis]MBB6110029.1 cell wall-associated NlpC family hydrolase [Mucilaginibacter lappiensis]SIR54980.1 NlpC/P60 family protein [Mucilaginibacter lappiensis]
MSKYLILLVFIGLTTSLFSKTHVRRFKLTHKIKTANAYLSTDSVSADTLLHFAQSLLGTRYRSRCSNPLVGFDCSGFVSYVFKKFNFNVPRSSCEFISVGQKVRLEDARPGDIILFTGTKKHTRRIGHVGIVYCNSSDEFKFIHSTSGKEHGVTISNMDERYKRRFVQVIRLLI